MTMKSCLHLVYQCAVPAVSVHPALCGLPTGLLSAGTARQSQSHNPMWGQPGSAAPSASGIDNTFESGGSLLQAGGAAEVRGRPGEHSSSWLVVESLQVILVLLAVILVLLLLGRMLYKAALG